MKMNMGNLGKVLDWGGRDFELKCDKTYPFNGAFATMLQ